MFYIPTYVGDSLGCRGPIASVVHAVRGCRLTCPSHMATGSSSPVEHLFTFPPPFLGLDFSSVDCLYGIQVETWAGCVDVVSWYPGACFSSPNGVF